MITQRSACLCMYSMRLSMCVCVTQVHRRAKKIPKFLHLSTLLTDYHADIYLSMYMSVCVCVRAGVCVCVLVTAVSVTAGACAVTASCGLM